MDQIGQPFLKRTSLLTADPVGKLSPEGGAELGRDTICGQRSVENMMSFPKASAHFALCDV
jgi:hypothetical protein